MRITFKAKHNGGVRYMGSESVQHIAKSRIDGFPIYLADVYDEEYLVGIWRRFVFDGRPGYTPQPTDFDIMTSIEKPFEPRMGMVDRYSGKSTTLIDDIIPFQPMASPTGGLYYLDYVYENELDNRLLLML